MPLLSNDSLAATILHERTTNEHSSNSYVHETHSITYDRIPMEILHVCKANQADSYANSFLQRAHSLYHRACPSYFSYEHSCASSRSVSTMPSCSSSSSSSDYQVKRTPSITSIASSQGSSQSSQSSRRSVKVMKTLLPLKLTSPSLQEDRSSTPPPVQRPAFRFSVSPPDTLTSILQRRAAKCPQSFASTSAKISPAKAKYRDTPVYTEVGSPQPDQAYFTKQDVCSSCSPTGSSCDESCIIHEYESDISTDEESSNGETAEDEWANGLAVTFDKDLPAVSNDDKELRTRISDLSFKCRGETNAFGTNTFPDEASWLSGTAPSFLCTIPRRNSARLVAKRKSTCSVYFRQSNHSPNVAISDHDAEGWLSDSSSCDDEDNIFVSPCLPAYFKLVLTYLGMCYRLDIRQSTCHRCEPEVDCFYTNQNVLVEMPAVVR